MKLGVALGGGGAPGVAAHVGFLAGLLSHGVQPEVLVGSSAGGLVSGAMAVGISLLEQAHFWSTLNEGVLVAEQTVQIIQRLLCKGPTPGLLDMRPVVYDLLKNAGTDRSVSSWKIGHGVVVSNLNRGKPEVLHRDAAGSGSWGTLEAMVATSAFPMVFEGVRHWDDLYQDGGMYDLIPTGACYDLGADKVVGVRVGGELRIPPVLSLENTARLSIAALVQSEEQATNRRKPDYLVSVSTLGGLISMSNWQADYEAGVRAANECANMIVEWRMQAGAAQ